MRAAENSMLTGAQVRRFEMSKGKLTHSSACERMGSM